MNFNVTTYWATGHTWQFYAWAWDYSFPLHGASLDIYLEYVSSVHLIGIFCDSQEPATFTALQRSSESGGWMVRAEVQSHNITTKGMFSTFKHFCNRMELILFSLYMCVAVSVTIQPAAMAPVEKRVMVHIDGDRLQPGKVELVRGNPSPPRVSIWVHETPLAVSCLLC